MITNGQRIEIGRLQRDQRTAGFRLIVFLSYHVSVNKKRSKFAQRAVGLKVQIVLGVFRPFIAVAGYDPIVHRGSGKRLQLFNECGIDQALHVARLAEVILHRTFDRLHRRLVIRFHRFGQRRNIRDDPVCVIQSPQQHLDPIGFVCQYGVFSLGVIRTVGIQHILKLRQSAAQGLIIRQLYVFVRDRLRGTDTFALSRRMCLCQTVQHFFAALLLFFQLLALRLGHLSVLQLLVHRRYRGLQLLLIFGGHVRLVQLRIVYPLRNFGDRLHRHGDRHDVVRHVIRLDHIGRVHVALKHDRSKIRNDRIVQVYRIDVRVNDADRLRGIEHVAVLCTHDHRQGHVKRSTVRGHITDVAVVIRNADVVNEALGVLRRHKGLPLLILQLHGSPVGIAQRLYCFLRHALGRFIIFHLGYAGKFIRRRYDHGLRLIEEQTEGDRMQESTPRAAGHDHIAGRCVGVRHVYGHRTRNGLKVLVLGCKGVCDLIVAHSQRLLSIHCQGTLNIFMSTAKLYRTDIQRIFDHTGRHVADRRVCLFHNVRSGGLTRQVIVRIRDRCRNGIFAGILRRGFRAFIRHTVVRGSRIGQRDIRQVAFHSADRHGRRFLDLPGIDAAVRRDLHRDISGRDVCCRLRREIFQHELVRVFARQHVVEQVDLNILTHVCIGKGTLCGHAEALPAEVYPGEIELRCCAAVVYLIQRCNAVYLYTAFLDIHRHFVFIRQEIAAAHGKAHRVRADPRILRHLRLPCVIPLRVVRHGQFVTLRHGAVLLIIQRNTFDREGIVCFAVVFVGICLVVNDQRHAVDLILYGRLVRKIAEARDRCGICLRIRKAVIVPLQAVVHAFRQRYAVIGHRKRRFLLFAGIYGLFAHNIGITDIRLTDHQCKFRIFRFSAHGGTVVFLTQRVIRYRERIRIGRQSVQVVFLQFQSALTKSILCYLVILVDCQVCIAVLHIPDRIAVQENLNCIAVLSRQILIADILLPNCRLSVKHDACTAHVGHVAHVIGELRVEEVFARRRKRYVARR